MILTNPKLGPQDVNIPRDRWRFRLRLTRRLQARKAISLAA